MRQRISESRAIQRSTVGTFISQKYLTRAYQLIVNIAIGCLMVKDFLRMCIRGMKSLFTNRRKVVMGIFIALITVTFLNGGFATTIGTSKAQAEVAPGAFMAPQSLVPNAPYTTVPVTSRMAPREHIQKIRVENDYRVRMEREKNRSRKDLMDFIGKAANAIR